MPLETTSNSAVESLTINQFAHWQVGDAWDTGCDVSIGSSTEDIVVSISQGAMYVGGTEVTVNAQQKILQTGDNENPRKDVVVVDENGSVDIVAGTPAPILSDIPEDDSRFDPVFHAYRPAPDELDGKDGELVPIAVVWVPPDTVSSSDLDGDITYVQDRRLKNPANAVTPELVGALADADDSVQANHLADGAVGSTSQLADAIVTAAKLDNVVASDVGAIEDGTDTVDATNLAADSVTPTEVDEAGDYQVASVGTATTQDLTTVTPAFDGQLLRDDGTNFTGGEYAYADTSAGVWRAFSDPANLTATY